MSLVIVTLMGFVFVSVWNEFFRFQAYGQLEGTTIELSTTTSGTVRAIYAHEGDLVQQGQLLVELDVPELEFQRLQLHRQLQLSVSDLQIRMAELDSQNRQLRADDLDRTSRYYQLLSQFHLNQSNLEKLEQEYRTSKNLIQQKAISQSEFIQAKTAFEGQQSQLVDLATAIKSLEKQAGLPEVSLQTAVLLKTEMDLVQSFQSELSRVESLIHAKEIRAPVTGRILKRLTEPGEQLSANKLVFEMVESDTIEAVVYLPQRCAKTLAVGDTIDLKVTPLGTSQTFRVDRFAPEVVAAPPAIQQKYRALKGLVRVHARPVSENATTRLKDDLTMWVGAELSLPRLSFPRHTNSKKRQNDSQAATRTTTVLNASQEISMNERSN